MRFLLIIGAVGIAMLTLACSPHGCWRYAQWNRKGGSFYPARYQEQAYNPVNPYNIEENGR